jgi:hypothetical protein
MGRCGRSTRLGVDEMPRDGRRRAVPQLVDEIGAGLVKDELDQSPGVEVDDQRRCSAMRFDTDPPALIPRLPARRRFGREGSSMSPRARRSASAICGACISLSASIGSSSHERQIPNLCDENGVSYLGINDYMRAESIVLR